MTFNEASEAIRAGRAVPHSLWVLLSSPQERDGYALKPAVWEGPGEYQHVSLKGESMGTLVYLPTGKSLPRALAQVPK